MSYASGAVLPTDLVELVKSCELLITESIKDYGTLLASYINGKTSSDRFSSLSNKQITSSASRDQHAHDLSIFRYVDISNPQQPFFGSFKMDECRLKEIVETKLTGLNFSKDKFQALLADLIEMLDKVRRILYQHIFASEQLLKWNELTVQKMMQLFLQYMLLKSQSDIEIDPANNSENNKISFIDEGTNLTWSGYTDIRCTSATIETNNIDDCVTIIEMKVPFTNKSSRLFHSTALQPKQQLLGQTMGLFQMKKQYQKFEKAEGEHVFSYLTDMFALSVMFHVENKVYLSERVTDAEAYCLRLLLMCCKLTTEEWTSLVGPCDVIQLDEEEKNEIDDDAESGGPRGEEDPSGKGDPTEKRNPTGKGDPNTGSDRMQTRSMNNNTNKDGAYNSKLGYRYKMVEDFSGDNEVDEEWFDEFLDMMRWHAGTIGEAYFGAKELYEHNLQTSKDPIASLHNSIPLKKFLDERNFICRVLMLQYSLMQIQVRWLFGSS
jgi:hypothetical protein